MTETSTKSFVGYLKEGDYVQYKVKDITPAADSYETAEKKKFFCHFFTLTDEDKVDYPIQICDLDNFQNYAEVGDTIEVKINKFLPGKGSKIGRYSAKFSKIVSKNPGHGPGVVTPGNPLMAGTAAAVALAMAVEMHKYDRDFDVLANADTYLEWLKSKV
jgi:hypothetical protein